MWKKCVNPEGMHVSHYFLLKPLEFWQRGLSCSSDWVLRTWFRSMCLYKAVCKQGSGWTHFEWYKHCRWIWSRPPALEMGLSYWLSNSLTSSLGLFSCQMTPVTVNQWRKRGHWISDPYLLMVIWNRLACRLLIRIQIQLKRLLEEGNKETHCIFATWFSITGYKKK